MPMIALDQIDAAPNPVRAHAAAASDDASLRGSIAALGVLQPVLLRPLGNRFVVVAGSRRVAAARELGLSEIPAHVEALGPQHDSAAQAAENLVRVPMAPLDQWRAIVTLQADGYTLDHASACLGLSLQHARRLDRLGRLHPDLIALIEKSGLPQENDLRQIASASPEKQRTAAALFKRGGWQYVARACREERIPRGRAIFDIETAGVLFEEDLFAEPGAPDAWFTVDANGFLAAQTAALQKQVATAKAEGRRVEIADLDKNGVIRLPKGFENSYGDPEKPKKTETVFLAVQTKQPINFGCILSTVGKPAKETAVVVPLRRTSPDASPDTAPAERAAAPAISGAGQRIILDAKLTALRERLDATVSRPMALTLALLVLAYTHDEALIRRLVPPAGAASLTLDEVGAVANEGLIGQLDYLDERAEWIGHAIGADAALPRFDTPQFLACVNEKELRRLAAEAHLPAMKSAAGLRAQLAGALPDWRPCGFGAPGPRPEPKPKQRKSRNA